MTVTLELKPDLADRLRAEVERRGVAAEQIIADALEARLSLANPVPATTEEERGRALRSFLEIGRNIEAPDIPDEALRREHLYEDRAW